MKKTTIPVHRLQDTNCHPWWKAAGLVLLLMLLAIPLQGGGIPYNRLQMPMGRGSDTLQGDYLSPDGSPSLRTYFAYYIEVPPSTASLVVQIFDADIGGSNSPFISDRYRSGGSWDTTVTYTLFNPSGGTAATVSGGNGTPTGANEAWITMATINNPAAGHWQFRVRMGAGENVNGFAMRAHDGDPGAGGRELNVYAHSYTQEGVHSGSSTSQLYPYIHCGCSFSSNAFDMDSSGSFNYYSRLYSATNPFSYTIPTADISGNDTWSPSISISGWTTGTWAADYGIWNSQLTISTGANYTTYYVGNYDAVSPPTVQPQANTFRIYFPTDAGTAPVKPFLTQTLSFRSGANPVVSGTVSRLRVQVTIFNPTPHAITFNDTRVIRTYINRRRTSRNQVTYVGSSAIVSQGTVTAQPSDGSYGYITWNPGTVAANSHQNLVYDINVNPTSNGVPLNVTSTPDEGTDGSGYYYGTTATFLDETGVAEYRLGPLCQMSLTTGSSGTNLPTAAVVTGLTARYAGGRAQLEWETAVESGTVGFYLHRWDDAAEKYVLVDDRMLLAADPAPQGASYRLADPQALPGNTYTYLIEEVDVTERERMHGPFTVQIPDLRFTGRRGAAGPEPAGDSSRSPRALTPRPEIKPLPERMSLARPLAGKGKTDENLAVKNRLRIEITEAGVYRLSSGVLAGLAGVTAEGLPAVLESAGLALSTLGKEVAWHPAPDGDGIWFYATPPESPYTKTGVYWLDFGPGRRMQEMAGAMPEAPLPGQAGARTVRAEQDLFPVTALADDTGRRMWMWDYLFADLPKYKIKEFPVTLTRPSGNGTASLSLNMASGTAGAHQVLLYLNGTKIGSDFWRGVRSRNLFQQIPNGLLKEGANTLKLELRAKGSVVFIDGYEISYNRLQVAADNQLLVRAQARDGISVNGFSQPGIMALDVLNPEQPRWCSQLLIEETEGQYSATAASDDEENRFLFFTAANVQIPAARMVPAGGSLTQPGQGAEYVVLAPRSLYQTAADLVSYRSGQGLASRLVALEDIYQEFGHGLPSPEAVRSFLTYARQNWNPAPRYAVLAGRGTFDYLNIQKMNDNVFPPLLHRSAEGYFGSDNLLAVPEGAGGAPSLVIGRIPAVTPEELQAYIQKLKTFEASRQQAWWQKVILLADNADEAGDFPELARSLLPVLPPSLQAEMIETDGQSPDRTRNVFFNSLDGGAYLVDFMGHGGLDRLAQEGILLSSDVPALTNEGRTPILAGMTCAIGRFDVPGFPSLAERLVLQPHTGAVACWAPSGFSLNGNSWIMNQAFIKSLFQQENRFLGDAILQALQAYAAEGGEDPSLPYLFILLGDPCIPCR